MQHNEIENAPTSSPLRAITDTGRLLGVLGCRRGTSKYGIVSSTPSRGLEIETESPHYKINQSVGNFH